MARQVHLSYFAHLQSSITMEVSQQITIEVSQQMAKGQTSTRERTVLMPTDGAQNWLQQQMRQ